MCKMKQVLATNLNIYMDKIKEKKRYTFAKKFLEINKQKIIKSILQDCDYKEFCNIFKTVAHIDIKFLFLAETLYIELSKIAETEKNIKE